MEITLNGEAKQVESSLLSSLVEELCLSNKQIAVEINRVIIRKDQYTETAINSGDVIEIINFVGGG